MLALLLAVWVHDVVCVISHFIEKNYSHAHHRVWKMKSFDMMPYCGNLSRIREENLSHQGGTGYTQRAQLAVPDCPSIKHTPPAGVAVNYGSGPCQLPQLMPLGATLLLLVLLLGGHCGISSLLKTPD